MKLLTERFLRSTGPAPPGTKEFPAETVIVARGPIENIRMEGDKYSIMGTKSAPDIPSCEEESSASWDSASLDK